jgi:hypothetical protein
MGTIECLPVIGGFAMIAERVAASILYTKPFDPLTADLRGGVDYEATNSTQKPLGYENRIGKALSQLEESLGEGREVIIRPPKRPFKTSHAEGTRKYNQDYHRWISSSSEPIKRVQILATADEMDQKIALPMALKYKATKTESKDQSTAIIETDKCNLFFIQQGNDSKNQSFLSLASSLFKQNIEKHGVEVGINVFLNDIKPQIPTNKSFVFCFLDKTQNKVYTFTIGDQCDVYIYRSFKEQRKIIPLSVHGEKNIGKSMTVMELIPGDFIVLNNGATRERAQNWDFMKSMTGGRSPSEILSHLVDWDRKPQEKIEEPERVTESQIMEADDYAKPQEDNARRAVVVKAGGEKS